MAKDSISAPTDSVSAGLVTEVTAPKHPCPGCGRESKEHNRFQETDDGPKQIQGARICSDRLCRREFNIYDA